MGDASVAVEQGMGRKGKIKAVAGDETTAVVHQAARRGERQHGGGGSALLDGARPVVEVGDLDVQVTGSKMTGPVVEAAGGAGTGFD